VALAAGVGQAYEQAYATDESSAFGGIIAVNRSVTLPLAEAISRQFATVVHAPGFAPEALELLQQKQSLVILETAERRRVTPGERDLRRVLGGVLVQDRDTESEDRQLMEVVTRTQPTEQQWGDLLFAWRVAKHVRSNAIVVARDLATLGIGAGQMSRVDSAELAVRKAGGSVAGAVAASDAFFPFADGLQALVDAGVAAVIQPGGSKRDDDTVAAVNTAGAAMVLTGRRHFRH
jgi:phosphoribosylaminoimidazolecarboxamide formyltransferase/IMP cyclohydrolase